MGLRVILLLGAGGLGFIGRRQGYVLFIYFASHWRTRWGILVEGGFSRFNIPWRICVVCPIFTTLGFHLTSRSPHKLVAELWEPGAPGSVPRILWYGVSFFSQVFFFFFHFRV